MKRSDKGVALHLIFKSRNPETENLGKSSNRTRKRKPILSQIDILKQSHTSYRPPLVYHK